MKNKLIQAETLLHALRDDISINGTNFARVKRHIENAPAVDAVEVVHGKWIDEGDGDWRCSKCRMLFSFDDYGDVHPKDDCGCNYCPNCGAKMDLEV